MERLELVTRLNFRARKKNKFHKYNGFLTLGFLGFLVDFMGRYNTRIIPSIIPRDNSSGFFLRSIGGVEGKFEIYLVLVLV